MSFKITLLLSMMALSAMAIPRRGSYNYYGTAHCYKPQFAYNECAYLYEDYDYDDDDYECEGWELPIEIGTTDLSYRHRYEAEAVVVKAGCTFEGFSQTNQGGRSIVVDASHRSEDLLKEFRGRRELEEMIASAKCYCGVGGSGGHAGSAGGSGGHAGGF
jgi:hypothetical protein